MHNAPLTKRVHLKHLSKDKKLLEAIFAPAEGMNLISFRKDGKEFIDQSTKADFDKRFAGLGALIGPHFYHRKQNEIPPLDPEIFPHISSLGDLSKTDPLSHGIGRYVSWNFDNTSSSITGTVCGLDTHNGKTLASLEGFNFKLHFSCHLTNSGLNIKYEVTNEEKPTTIGLHYYLALKDKKGSVTIKSKKQYNDMGTFKDIPNKWRDSHGNLHFDLKNESDFGFFPDTTDNTGQAVLKTKSHSLKISYKAFSDQHAFQLYHPKDGSFVCIEPVSAKNPRAPEGLNHKLHINIEVL
ncbi:MAG: hypothetical protein S4CHLAM20_02390 [Chlamydiia bacterium]|nr:hypothetical protein [Chlamydiia bacterium]